MSFTVPEISVADLAQKITNNDSIFLLDVREDHEVQLCCISGATHISLGQLPNRLDEIPDASNVVVYCHHGGRSARATAFLLNSGFEHVVNLNGGIDRWALEIASDMPQY